jgi:ribonuclease HI
MKIKDQHIKALEDKIPAKDRQKFLDNAIEQALKEHELMNAKELEVFVDGGSRGNPGHAGGGFAVYSAGKLVHKGSEYFGEITNNQAEYLALRLALREIYAKFGNVKIKCCMDSQLVVEQMNGNYKVKSENIQPLFTEIQRITDQFKSFSIKHIRREQNQLADKLANDAMNRKNS